MRGGFTNITTEDIFLDVIADNINLKVISFEVKEFIITTNRFKDVGIRFTLSYDDGEAVILAKVAKGKNRIIATSKRKNLSQFKDSKLLSISVSTDNAEGLLIEPGQKVKYRFIASDSCTTRG